MYTVVALDGHCLQEVEGVVQSDSHFKNAATGTIGSFPQVPLRVLS